ncbi:MAG: hypothetical protein V1873_05415 [Verrucomicrobiota bacterium]
MKSWTIVMMVVAVLVLSQPLQASAINKEWSAVLGFLGGYMVANGGLGQRAYCDEPVVIQRPVYVEQPVVREVIVEEPGHYEYREERIWVPARWVIMESRCGYERVWQPGYYQVETIRVWVPGCERMGHGERPGHRRCRR